MYYYVTKESGETKFTANCSADGSSIQEALQNLALLNTKALEQPWVFEALLTEKELNSRFHKKQLKKILAEIEVPKGKNPDCLALAYLYDPLNKNPDQLASYLHIMDDFGSPNSSDCLHFPSNSGLHSILVSLSSVQELYVNLIPGYYGNLKVGHWIYRSKKFITALKAKLK